MTTNFNLESLRLGASVAPGPSVTTRPKARGPYKTKAGVFFLKGPIPWPWLTLAARAPGRALHVAVAIWFYAGMKRTSTLALNLSRLTDLGVKRDAARRGLKALERAGLVKVVRHPGRKPRISLLRLKLRTPPKPSKRRLR